MCSRVPWTRSLQHKGGKGIVSADQEQSLLIPDIPGLSLSKHSITLKFLHSWFVSSVGAKPCAYGFG